VEFGGFCVDVFVLLQVPLNVSLFSRILHQDQESVLFVRDAKVHGIGLVFRNNMDRASCDTHLRHDRNEHRDTVVFEVSLSFPYPFRDRSVLPCIFHVHTLGEKDNVRCDGDSLTNSALFDVGDVLVSHTLDDVCNGLTSCVLCDTGIVLTSFVPFVFDNVQMNFLLVDLGND